MKTKTFDCVAMKHEIQQRLKREAAGQSWSQRSEDRRRRLAADPHLARLLSLFQRRGAPDDNSPAIHLLQKEHE